MIFNRMRRFLLLLKLVRITLQDIIALMEDYFRILSAGIHIIPQQGNIFLWEFDTPSGFCNLFGMVHFLD